MGTHFAIAFSPNGCEVPMPKKRVARKQPHTRRRDKRSGLPSTAGPSPERTLSQLPEHSTASGLRQAGMLQAQREQGNQAAGRLIQTAPEALIQREKAKSKAKGGGTHGRGFGALKNAKEIPYDVSGASLNDLTGQLKNFGGFAAEYTADLTIKGKAQVTKTKDGRKKITVKWQLINAQVQLPRWADYDQACPAAQAEWDRFMGALRTHEQAKHIDMAEDFVKNLSGEDVEIVADTSDELKSKLEAKQIELGGMLQAAHDACGHGTGAAGDAVLQPSAGTCEDEKEEQAEESGSSSSEADFGGFLGEF
jgi:predicted secreted Zn-dependent protease